jgi:sn-glycerol 3-phosphate transport system ATP-binding protein
VVLLRGGRIEQVGTPEDLYARPATAFTASFIGAPPMNLVKREGLMLGVRPEDMRLSADSASRLSGRVESVEYLGADSLVAISSHDASILVRVPGRATSRAGDTVHVSWDPAHEHRFDASTGGRQG